MNRSITIVSRSLAALAAAFLTVSIPSAASGAAPPVPQAASAVTILSTSARDALLRKFSPIWVEDSTEGEAIADPSDFVNGCTILDRRRDEFVRSPSGDNEWTSQELEAWLRRSSANRARSADFKINIDNRVREEGPNEARKRSGWGLFGQVTHLNDDLYSVKYFHFRAWNETAYSGGYGNHEGDWMCVDLQVKAPSVSRASIVYGIYHNHGRQIYASASKMRFHSGRPEIYMENGTHETWPQKGPRGLLPDNAGVKYTKIFGCGEGLSSDYKVCRHHRGDGHRYDSLGKVRNLETDRSRSTYLFLAFKGTWGKVSYEDPFGLVDVDNPRGPRYQSKMWDRSFVPSHYRDDPKPAPGVWKVPNCD